MLHRYSNSNGTLIIPYTAKIPTHVHLELARGKPNIQTIIDLWPCQELFMHYIGPRENVIKINSIITMYMEVIVFDGFLYKYLCDLGKSQKKDWFDIFLQLSNLWHCCSTKVLKSKRPLKPCSFVLLHFPRQLLLPISLFSYFFSKKKRHLLPVRFAPHNL